MTNSTKTASCCRLFKGLDILSLQAQYILSISMFVRVNKGLFTFNSQVHNYNTRIIHDLRYPQTTIAQFQKRNMLHGSKGLSSLAHKNQIYV
jgi:hypothetical protein